MSSQLHGVRAAIEALQAGEPVLVHDFADREGEVDMIYPAGAVGPGEIARLRNDAGGLICVALSDEVANTFDLPFLTEAVTHPTTDSSVGYDDRSAFSITVNHRDVYTGVTDQDRARTIQALAAAAANPDEFEFAEQFRSPGHVHLLRAAPSLSARQGHTELGIALARVANLVPAMVVCEMLDDTTGKALAPDAARQYAERYGLVFIEGSVIVSELR